MREYLKPIHCYMQVHGAWYYIGAASRPYTESVAYNDSTLRLYEAWRAELHSAPVKCFWDGDQVVLPTVV